MINLFNLNTFKLNTNKYSNLLHDKNVNEFENIIAEYVGAKYAVSFNSATSAIFLALLNKTTKITVPSMIPPVVLNAIITSGNKYKFSDDTNWIGDSYILHDFGDYKIVDSAQKLEKDQFKKECNDSDLMVFSFYPTKPVGSCDGGMIVSNDINKINHLKSLAFNGMIYADNNWDRKIIQAGYKMYMNSIQAEIAMNNFTIYEAKLNKLKVLRDFYNEKFSHSNTSDHLYRVSVPSNRRSEVIAKMKKENIVCGIHYDAMHTHDVYRVKGSKCPLSDSESKQTLSIPFNEKITQSQAKLIVKLLKDELTTTKH